MFERLKNRDNNLDGSHRAISNLLCVIFITIVLSWASLSCSADSAKKIPYPSCDGKKADIWVFCGQSNSQGWALFKAPVESDKRILFFYEPGWPPLGQQAPANEISHWVNAQEPLNKKFYSWTPPPVEKNIFLQRTGVLAPDNFNLKEFMSQQTARSEIPQGGVGPGIFFAKHILKFIDQPIGLMYCGVGGSPIFTWDPTRKSEGGGGNYFKMLESIAAAGGNIKGIIYLQGETDGMAPGQWKDYEQSMLHLIDGIRHDTNNPDLPFIYYQIGRFVHPYGLPENAYEKVRDTQRRVAIQRKKVYMVSSIDLPTEDSCHLSFEAYQRLGVRLAEIVLTEVYKQAGHGKSIILDSIEVIQPENRRPMIRVRFSGVSGRLKAAGRPTGFELRPKEPLQNPEYYFTKQKDWNDPVHVVYRVDFDPEDPAAVILGVFDNAQLLGKPHPLTDTVNLFYAAGADPYVNIVDEKDIPIPAFGPVEVKVKK